MSNLGKFHNHHQPPGMIGAQKMGILKIHKSAGSWMLASDWVHQAVSALHHHRAHQYLDFVFKGQGVVRYVKWPKETAQVFFLLFVINGMQTCWFEMIEQKFTMHIHARI